MSGTSPSNPAECGMYTSLWDAYRTAAPYGIPFVAPALAIIPTFRLFEIKAALQLEQTAKQSSVLQSLNRGRKESLLLGGTIGMQINGQALIEKGFAWWSGTEKASPQQKTASSLMVGMVTAPFLAAFNGKTIGLTFWQSVKNLTPLQFGAITGREAIIVGAMGRIKPICAMAKEKFGDHKSVGMLTAFGAGAGAAAASHCADTVFTRLQKEMPIKFNMSLLKGVGQRALAVGIITVLYNEIEEQLTPKK